MKIITYDKDGKQKSVKEFPDFVPDYIKHFDDNKSFLNITKDDLALFGNQKLSLKEELRKRWLSDAIKYDYRNFVNDYSTILVSFPSEEDRSKYPDLTGGKLAARILQPVFLLFRFTRELSALQDALAGKSQKVRINGKLKESEVKRNVLEKEKLEESIVSKRQEIKRVLGQIERISNIWLLFYVYVNSKKSNEHESDPNPTLSCQTQFIDLVGKYYSALKNLDGTVDLPETIKIQMTAMKSFAEIASNDINLSTLFPLNTQELNRILVSALYDVQQSKRSELYKLIFYASSTLSMPLKDSMTNGTYSTMSFEKHERESNYSDTSLYFRSYGANDFSILLSDAEYIANGTPLPKDSKHTRDSIFADVRDLLYTIYNEYMACLDITVGWNKQLKHDFEKFNKVTGKDGIEPFYIYWTDKIETCNASVVPQICYKQAVVSYSEFGHKIDFSHALIIDILHLRLINKDNSIDNQIGIYETKYKIDKLNENMSPMDSNIILEDNPITDTVLRYLTPILDDSYINTKIIDSDGIKWLVKHILSKKPFLDLIHKRPKLANSFIGGEKTFDFNIVLVCNLIGALNGKDLFRESAQGLSRLLTTDEMNRRLYGFPDKKNINDGETIFRKYMRPQNNDFDEEINTKIDVFIQTAINSFKKAHT